MAVVLVRSFVSVAGFESDFYSTYTPTGAVQPAGSSLSILNITIEANKLYLTCIRMRDQSKDEVLEDSVFDLQSLESGSAEPIVSRLAAICDRSDRPCDRIMFFGLAESPVADFLRTLAIVRKLLPARPPVVVESFTIKEGIAARHHTEGSLQFLEMEGLVNHPGDGDSHP